jgi:hypothetical protein
MGHTLYTTHTKQQQPPLCFVPCALVRVRAKFHFHFPRFLVALGLSVQRPVAVGCVETGLSLWALIVTVRLAQGACFCVVGRVSSQHANVVIHRNLQST